MTPSEPKIWDRFLTERDRAVFAQSGYGARQGFGERPALVVVDVTYGFVGDEPLPILDSSARWPDSCGAEAWDGVAAIERLLKCARAADVPVVYTKGLAPTGSSLDSGRWADKNARWCEDGRRGQALDIVREIAPLPEEVVIEKPKPSAFSGTPLAAVLVDLKADSLIVCGTTTSGCVRATVLDAFSLNYRVAVVEEATFDRGEASHALSLFDMDLKYADVVSLDHALLHLERCASRPTSQVKKRDRAVL